MLKKAPARKSGRTYCTIPPKNVIRGRKRLARLQRQGKDLGFIAQFARENHVTQAAGWFALRGLTYKDLPGAVKAPKRRSA